MYKLPKGIGKILHRGIWHIPTNEKKIFLTFDDGPCEQTHGLLSLLSQYGAHATFFCLGKNARKNPELMKRMVSEGHAIGNHGEDHINGWEFRKKCEEYVENAVQANDITSSEIFRPAYGKTTLEQRKALLKLGFKIVMWSFNSKDYKTTLDVKKVVDKVKKSTSPGMIFLFHDSVKASGNTILMLEILLPFWVSEGFEFGVISGEEF